MTEEELFKVYIKREVCAHCRFPQFCKGEKDCSDIAIIKRHYLAGVEAGKSQAETDLAIAAYMQGAEQYKLKWHDLRNNPNDLPEPYTTVLDENSNKVEYIGYGKHIQNIMKDILKLTRLLLGVRYRSSRSKLCLRKKQKNM